METISIRVHGRVQGVYYRQSTKEKAIELGITGTVQNNSDKSVTIIATGTAAALSLFKDWCAKGPSRAIVTSLTVTTLPLLAFTDFSILRS